MPLSILPALWRVIEENLPPLSAALAALLAASE